MIDTAVKHDPFAYLGVIDERGERVWDFLVVRRPPREPWWSLLVQEFGGRIIGISSNRDFPNNRASVLERSAAWLHCFRRPELIFPSEMPIALISRSDFCDPAIIRLSRTKKYDVVYCCRYGQKESKNFEFMVDILPLLSAYSVRLLLPGFPSTEVRYLSGLHNKLTISNTKLKHEHFIGALSEARVCLFPNKNDASPRVMAEALCMNMPVLVNRDIVGGWKYVNETTGRFFEREDVVVSFEECLQIARHPRCNEWFKDNYGENSKVRLARFLNENFGTQLKKADFSRLDRSGTLGSRVRKAFGLL